MKNKEEYLDFVASDSYKHQIDIWYKTYNISREKKDLFYDFLVSLYDLVDETYLGSDVMSSEIDQKNHFTWAWDKIIDSFEKEKIYFKRRENCYEYMWNFFLEAYYLSQLIDNQVKIKNYFEKLFDFSFRKTRSELDMLSEVYKLFDKNLEM